GMNDYLSKPYTPEALFRHVESMPLESMHSTQPHFDHDDSDNDLTGIGIDRMLPVRPPADTVDGGIFDSESSSIEDTKHVDDLPLIDADVLMQSVGGEIAMLTLMVETLHEELPRQLARLKAEVIAEVPNPLAISRQAHTIKGSAAALGAARLQHLAGLLESKTKLASQNESFDLIDTSTADWAGDAKRIRWVAEMTLKALFEYADTQTKAITSGSTSSVS
ncbi:MAG: Hpt domain-containing protein, partial [Planctomycetota bacterium]